MSVPPPRLAGPDAGAHPALLSRRFHDLTLAAVTGLIALGLALAITLAVPHPNIARVAAIIVGGLVVFVLLVSPRYTVTVTILVVYLGLLDGPVKLLTASQSASSVRNILTLAIALGMLVRLSVGKGPLKLPPLAGWVLAFVAIVLMQALNPATHGILKVIGGFRQELQWIPFFFFGYLLMRSKVRFRQMFLILGVIALANGAVSAYQARISPTALASWGPGYGSKVPRGRAAGPASRAARTPSKAKRETARRGWPLIPGAAGASACSPCPGCWRCCRWGGCGEDGSPCCASPERWRGSPAPERASRYSRR
jgi:hypothetical protein